MNEGKPVRVLEEVLEGAKAVRRYAAKEVLDIARVRYLAQDTSQGTLPVWVDKHPHQYARGFSTTSAQTTSRKRHPIRVPGSRRSRHRAPGAQSLLGG